MRWWAGLVVLLLGGCDLVLLGDERPTVIEPVGPFQRLITISPSSDSALDEFPVNVVTDADPALEAHARADGGDIGFTKLDGTLLPFERVAYANGSLEAWVKLDIRRQTQFVMHYGGDVIPFAREQVWANEVIAVYHLTETSSRAEDSTRYGRHLNPVGSRDPGTAPGKVGNGRAFKDGSETTCDRLCAPMGVHIGSSSFSFSLWIEAPPVNTTLGAYDMPIYAGGATDTDPGVDLEITETGWSTHIADGTNVGAIGLTTHPVNRWAHVAFVVRRNMNDGLAFLDGQRNGMATLVPFGEIDTSELCIGGPYGFGGKVDEVRIYSTAKQEDWFDAEYDNVMNRGQFITIGDEQAVP